MPDDGVISKILPSISKLKVIPPVQISSPSTFDIKVEPSFDV